MDFSQIWLWGLVLWLPVTAYYSYGIYAAIGFFLLQNHKDDDFEPEIEFLPPITILKPVCGLDGDDYLNFASFCMQNYPKFQLIFAVRDPNDPAIAVILQVMSDFPQLDLEIVQSNRLIGTNLKISNLANALPQAKYEILVLADSDVRVDSKYLRTLVKPLAKPEVGAVTCLYRPVVTGWVATLEAIGISTDYLASVLVANKLEGIKFALGTTIAIRQDVLAEIGGFAAIAEYLADDYQIGYLTAKAGYEVVLSNYIIDHLITTHNFRDLLNRQLRWAYCTKVSRPWSYLALFFTQGTVTSLIFGLIYGGWAWAGVAVTWILRFILAWLVGVWGLKDPKLAKSFWLVPIRDGLSFGIWVLSWFSNSMDWRGQKFSLSAAGKLIFKETAVKSNSEP